MADALSRLGYIVHQLCALDPHKHSGAPCQSPGKVPTERGWQKRDKPLATAAARALRSDRGIGVLTGRGLIVIDCDRGPAPPSGADNLARLYEAHPDAMPEPTVHTGGGGAHYWYQVTSGLTLPNTASKIAPLVDTRGDGGQVVVPPSPHASGAAYEWAPGYPLARAELPALPLWLLDMIRPTPPPAPAARAAPQGGKERVSDQTHWEEMIARHPFNEGTRNDSLNALAFYLGQRSSHPDAPKRLAELRELARASGLNEQETTATITSGGKAGQGAPHRPPLYLVGAGAPPQQPASSTRPPDPPPPQWRPELLPTDESAAVRLLLEAPSTIMLCRTAKGHSQVRVAGKSGVWKESIDQVMTLHNRANAHYRARVEQAKESGAKGLGRLINYCDRAAGATGGRRAIDSVGGALEALAATRPAAGAALTRCNDEDLDAQLQFLGAPNGVIDLHTGTLLTDDAAKRCLVTTTIPDPFVRSAGHPDVERLTAHMSPETERYLLDEIAYSLLGKPSRRILMIIGPKGGGKTTLSESIGAAIGAYGSALSAGAISRGWHTANAATPDMCSVMPPYRLARSAEMSGLRIDAERAKALSAGDRQSYRQLYGAPQEGVPSATMLFTGNALPESTQWLADEALLERLRVLTYPVVPNEARAPHMAAAFALGAGQEGRVRRQALIAKLVQYVVRHCLEVGPDSPPDMPDALWENSERAKDDAHGPLGNALRLLITPSEPGAFVTTDAVWDRLQSAFAVKDDKIEGLTRRQITRLLAAMHELGAAEVLSVEGRARRGWKAWSFTPPTDQ